MPAAEAARRAADFGPRDLATLAKAFARSGSGSARLALFEAIAAEVARRPASFEPRELVAVAHACAQAGHAPPALFEGLAAEAESQGHPVRLLWLNYPHMPTGEAPDPGRLTDVVAWAKARGVLVVHDNPYARILNPGPPFSLLSLPGAEGAVELHSLSKGHRMAGPG